MYRFPIGFDRFSIVDGQGLNSHYGSSRNILLRITIVVIVDGQRALLVGMAKRIIIVMDGQETLLLQSSNSMVDMAQEYCYHGWPRSIVFSRIDKEHSQ